MSDEIIDWLRSEEGVEWHHSVLHPSTYGPGRGQPAFAEIKSDVEIGSGIVTPAARTVFYHSLTCACFTCLAADEQMTRWKLLDVMVHDERDH